MQTCYILTHISWLGNLKQAKGKLTDKETLACETAELVIDINTIQTEFD